MANERTTGQDIKLRNKLTILNYVYKRGKTSKQQLAKALRMSLPTILQNIKELTEEGLIVSEGQMESTGGRKAALISPVRNARMAVGVDIARRHVELVLINLTGDIVRQRRHACAYERTETYYNEIGRMVDSFVMEAGIDTGVLLGVGVSIPGIIDNAGTMITDSHVLAIQRVPCGEFSKYISYPCLFINDANAAGLSELNAEDSLDTFAYLSLNNCVGGAFFTHRKMSLGDNQRAGEFGHMRLIPRGRTCYCGMDGCVDAYCNAMVLTSAVGGDLERFFERLKSGDPKLSWLWDEYLDALAVTVNNLRMAFDCPIVLGGYVGGYLGEYLGEIQRRAGYLNTFAQEGGYVRTSRARVHTSALGAALQHTEAFFRHI